MQYDATAKHPVCCASITEHCCMVHAIPAIGLHRRLADDGAMQGLREWQAFIDCKKTIDVFLAELPLFQSLAHKSMRPRCVNPKP